MKSKIIILALLLCCASLAWAQDETPTAVTVQNRAGDLPFSQTVGTGVEHVDVGSGNLVVDVPIISLPGRHMPFNYGLRYNALFWTVKSRATATGQVNGWAIERRPYVGGGQGLGFTPTQPQLSWGVSTETCTNVFGTDQDTLYTARDYLYTDAGGGKHALPILQYVVFSPDGGCFTGLENASQLQNFSPAEAILARAPDVYSTPAIYMPDGTQVAWPSDNSILNPPVTPDGWSPLYLGQYLDTNGNSKCEPGACLPAIDTLGRTPLIIVNNGPSQILYYFYDSNGTQQTYTVNLGNIIVATAFHIPSTMGVVSEMPPTWRSVVSSIVLPNGTSYAFQYENGSYGGLTGITLPTGATISYTWATLSPPGNPWLTHRYVAIRTVTVGGQTSTWTFSKSCVDSGCSIVNTDVGDPLGNHTLYQHAEGQVVFAKNYNGAVGSSPFREYDVVYDTYNGLPMTGALPIRVTTILENGLQAKVEYDYDITSGIPGNVSEVREFAYASGTPVTLLRRTHKAYGLNTNPNYLAANIVDKVTQETVYDSTANTCQGVAVPCAQTQYEYDNYVTGDNPLQPTTGAAQHDYTGHGSTFTLRGNATRVKHWRNTDGAWLTTTYSYDDLGNIRAIKDPLSHTTTYDYADSFANGNCPPPLGTNGQAWVSTVTNALGHQTKVTRYPCTGLLQAHRDQNDINAARPGTTYSYDMIGRVLTNNFVDGGQIATTYNDVPPVSVVTTTKIALANGATPPLNMISTSVHDSLGRPQQTQLNSDPEGVDYTDTTYDLLGRVATVSNPHRTTVSSTDGVTGTLYDTLGRVTQVTRQDGSISTVSYTGNCTTTTDEAGKQRKTCSDALGRLTSVFEDPAGLNYETDYQYDVLGNLLRVDQKGSAPSDSTQWRTRVFTYNSLSQLLTAYNPESGNKSYAYDNDGNLLMKTSPAPNPNPPQPTQTISYCYDELHRVTKKDYQPHTYSPPSCPIAAPVVTYTYDQGTNGIGHLTSVTDQAGSGSYSYDPMGRISGETRVISGASKSLTYDYNLDASLKALHYPSGRIVNYAYNSAGRALTVQDGNGALYVTNATHWPSGAEYQRWMPNIYFSTTLNNRLQIGGFYSDNGQTSSYYLNKTYNYGAQNNGNVMSIVNNKDSSRTATFTYDSLNRIAAGWSTANTGALSWGENYTIDAWGNLIIAPMSSKAHGGNFQCASDSGNRATCLAYDAAGNVTANGAASYAYDQENRMSSSAGTNYVYDANGNRVKKSSGSTGTLYWYGSPGIIAETDLTGTLKSEYVFFGGKRIARIDSPGNSVHYYLSDHLNSTTMVVSAVGQSEEESDYSPYGSEYQVTNTGANHYKFTGKEREIETGLDYFGTRYYGSAIGRFTRPDEFHNDSHVSNSQSWNLYSYTRNNPLSYVDPTGKAAMGASCYADGNGCAKSDGSGYSGNDELGLGDPYLYRGIQEATQNAPPTPNTVIVGERPLLRRGADHWYHTYLLVAVFVDGKWVYANYGVLGEIKNGKGTSDNQQVRENDPLRRNGPKEGSNRNHLFAVAVSEAQREQLLSGARYWSQPGHQCPSCGPHYVLGGPVSLVNSAYNSNTWVYNMLIQNPAGRIEPPLNRDLNKHTAPGWEVNDVAQEYYPKH